MGIGSLRDRSARYSGSARGLRKAWQSARSCEAASTNPALRILAAHIRTPRLGMAVAGSRDRSTPYSGSARGLRRAWQSARSCKAASTHRSVRLSAGHIRALRLGVAEAMLRFQSAPYSGSLRGLGRAWQSVRICEAASTNPALTIRGPHTRGARFGVAEAMLRLRSAPYSGSLRGLGKASTTVANLARGPGPCDRRA